MQADCGGDDKAIVYEVKVVVDICQIQGTLNDNLSHFKQQQESTEQRVEKPPKVRYWVEDDGECQQTELKDVEK